MSNDASKKSKYYSNLNNSAKKRYKQKLSELKILNDPLTMDKNNFDTTDVTKWPDISFADIFCYLINYPSQYSQGSLKAYKSLEAYKYVISGIVFNVQVKSIGENCLVAARVRDMARAKANFPKYQIFHGLEFELIALSLMDIVPVWLG